MILLMEALDDESATGDPTEVWPPVGFSSYYAMKENLDGHAELSYDLVLPGTFAEVDLATVRIGRHGGPNEEDLGFRGELHRHVGAVTVAGGHVEMAMKRLLLVLTSPPKADFSTVDLTWTVLHKELVGLCDGSDDRRKQLAQVLDWGQQRDVKRRRDDVVHADWWEFAGCEVRRSRFVRGGKGKTILSSLNDLDEDARLLTEYADRLDAFLGNDWIIARLPGPCHFRSGVSSSALPVEDAEGPEHGVA
jgi:hypothetical protein